MTNAFRKFKWKLNLFNTRVPKWRESKKKKKSGRGRGMKQEEERDRLLLRGGRGHFLKKKSVAFGAPNNSWQSKTQNCAACWWEPDLESRRLSLRSGPLNAQSKEIWDSFSSSSMEKLKNICPLPFNWIASCTGVYCSFSIGRLTPTRFSSYPLVGERWKGYP